MKKKGNKKMPSPRYKLIHNLIPTSLFCFKFCVCCECIRQRKKSSPNWLHEISLLKQRCRDGVMNEFVSG